MSSKDIWYYLRRLPKGDVDMKMVIILILFLALCASLSYIYFKIPQVENRETINKYIENCNHQLFEYASDTNNPIEIRLLITEELNIYHKKYGPVLPKGNYKK